MALTGSVSGEVQIDGPENSCIDMPFSLVFGFKFFLIKRESDLAISAKPMFHKAHGLIDIIIRNTIPFIDFNIINK